MPTPPERILIVAVNWLGDLLFMTPAIRAIRKRYPKAHLACLVAPRGVELLLGNPHLDEVIPLEECRGPANSWRLLRMAGQLRPKRFDTAFLFHRSFSRTLMVCLAGIPSRIGYHTPKRGWLLTQSAPMPARDSLSKTQWFLNLLSEVGIAADGNQYDAGLLPEDEQAAQRLVASWNLQPEEKLVALHAGANWRLKRWSSKRFSELADALQNRSGIRVLFIGGKGDRSLVQGIVDRMKRPPIVAVGQTTFRQLGALLQQSQLLISNDSGPLHMGLAVGTPTIALFGPTDPQLTGPPEGARSQTLFGSIGCPVPCYQLNCPVNLCMDQITVEQVLEASEKFL